MRRTTGRIALIAVVALIVPLAAQPSREDDEVLARIRQEEARHSEILRTLHVLADVYGPRLTGGPSVKAAAEWAVNTMKEWGLQNGRLEPWDFGRAGWSNDFVAAHMLAPVRDQLTVEVLAWTPGTNGTVRAPAVAIEWPDRPTSDQLNTALSGARSAVKGAIVLAGRPAKVPVNLTPRPGRRDESDLQRRYDPAAPDRARGPNAERSRGALTAGEINRRVDEFLLEHGALARINDAARELGQIAAFQNPRYDVTKAPPTLVMRNEDYGRISRILADGLPVRLELTIVNQTHPEGRTSYNAIAEIPGTDKRDEVVMLGAHLDSWQAATGATDNAVGCAVMMEAVRLLQTLGVRPRRTIRVALWSGEEQGLLGSQAYVREHFGSFERPKSDYGNLIAYLNLDTGTGRVRGASVFGPPDAASAMRRVLAPFKDLGVVGSGATTRRALGGTDSTTFAAAGLPGINLDQDPIQYDSATHHTNLDTYERIIDEDVRASAVVVAGAIYQLAMADEPLPRFDRRTMPEGSWR